VTAVEGDEISGFRQCVVKFFAFLGMLSPKHRYPTTSQRRATKKREDASGNHALVGTAGSSFAKTILQLAVLLIVYFVFRDLSLVAYCDYRLHLRILYATQIRCFSVNQF
jgi:hypothetical protein